MTGRVSLTKFAQTSILFLTFTILLLEGFIVWALLQNEPSHHDIIEQLEINRDRTAVVTCLLAVPEGELTTEAVAGCQVDP